MDVQMFALSGTYSIQYIASLPTNAEADPWDVSVWICITPYLLCPIQFSLLLGYKKCIIFSE